MSKANVAQTPNTYNPPSDLSTDEWDDNVWDQIDHLDDSEEAVQNQAQDSMNHTGSIQDRIKVISNGTRNISPATLEELNQVLNLAMVFDNHHLQDKAWGEIDRATVLLKQNGVQGGSSAEGEEADSSQEVLSPDHKDEDTAASHIDRSQGIATYQSNPEVTLHNTFNNDGVNTYNIKDAETFTIFPEGPNDSFVVTFEADTHQLKITATSDKNNKAQPKTYFVDPTSLNNKMIIASSKVDVSQLSKEERDKVQVGLDEATDEKNKKLDIINSAVWPSEGITPHVDISNTNSSHAGGGGDRAEEISKMIDSAMKSGKWAGVRNFIIDNSNHDWNWGWTQYDDEYMNDAVRKIVTGIYRASGATSDNDPKFMGLLKKIPVEVRYALRDGVLKNQGEIHESHGDQWDSQRTGELLEASIKSETGDSESGTSPPKSTE